MSLAIISYYALPSILSGVATAGSACNISSKLEDTQNKQFVRKINQFPDSLDSYQNGKYQQALEAAGVTKTVSITPFQSMITPAQARGTRSLPGEAEIMMDPDFLNHPATPWVMLHELGHIKNNDLFTMPLVKTIAVLATSILLACTLPFTLPYAAASFIIASIVGFAAETVFSRYREGEADRFAAQQGSIEDLQEGKKLLEALIENNKAERNTSVWNKIKISPSGENRSDLWHPSLRSRVDRLETAIRQKQDNLPVV